MLKFTPACFGGASPASTAPAPTKMTSCYFTRLGEVSLTWSRSFFGLSLLVDLRLFPSPKAINQSNFEHILVCIFFFLALKRKGSKRVILTTAGGRCRAIELAWDFSGATFSRGFGPEPAAGYSVAVAVDGEVVLIAGDRREEAFRRIKSARPGTEDIVTEPISRRVYSKLKEIERTTSWTVIVRFGGREREVSVSIDLKRTGMKLAVDGETLLHLRHIQWKFRGSERVAAKSGDRIRVSWDLHRLLFWTESGEEDSPAAPEMVGDAVFVLQFENRDDANFRAGMLCGRKG
ncbi:hypothetical protein KSP40_PGU018720 [Platanthera guangdongensis]|uniref:Uncharacterized protein n=1 Tax=Platanthera guangdongensis TaxID=2320717 RepID=A0ABR2LFN8_9ASPA